MPSLLLQVNRTVVAAADRPVWFPGNEAEIPAYLDGTLPGEPGEAGAAAAEGVGGWGKGGGAGAAVAAAAGLGKGGGAGAAAAGLGRTGEAAAAHPPLPLLSQATLDSIP